MNLFRTEFWTGLCLCSVVVNTYAIDVGGMMSSDTTWANTSEVYNIITPIQIAYGTTLTIDPSVQVAGGEIHVYGVLNISGTSESKVNLSNVHIIPGNNSSSEPYFISISHANLIEGSLYSPTGNGVYGSLLIEDSHLKDLKDQYGNNTYIYIWYPVSDVIIRRNIFDNFAGFSVGTSSSSANIIFENNHFKNFRTKYSSYAYWGWVTCWNAKNSTVSVSGNSFDPETLNGYPAVSLRSGSSGAAINAQSNYWGTTSDSDIQQMIYDQNDDLACAGYIGYIPFLSTHHPDTPILGPEIRVVHSPNGINLPNDSQSIEFECPIGLSSEPEIFEIQNIGNADLTSLSLNLIGSLADEFEFSPLSSSTLIPGDSMTFSITYSPVDSGTGSAQLNITNNDADENPFFINLSTHALSQDNDTDGDGLNDVAEYHLSDLGFNWKSAQVSLVHSLSNGVIYAQEVVKNLPCTIYQSPNLKDWSEVKSTNFSMRGLSIEMTEEGLSLNLGLNALIETNSASCMFYKATLD